MEKLSYKKFISIGLVFGLGLTACGQTSEEPVAPKQDRIVPTKEGNDFELNIEFLPSGKRVIRQKSAWDGEGYIAPIYQFCDGTDLIDATEGSKRETSVSRSPDHLACADGRLDPADFQINTTTSKLG